MRSSKKGLLVLVLRNAETCLTIPSNPVVRICKKDAPCLSLQAVRMCRPSYESKSQYFQAATKS